MSLKTAKTMKISGKVAVVLGGARGIGQAVTELLLKEGAKVCIGDINVDLGRTLRDKLHIDHPNSILFQQCDITKDSHINDIFCETEQRFGCVEIFVNTVGICDEYQWREMLTINLGGLIASTYIAKEWMDIRKGKMGGVIVHYSSRAGLQGTSPIPVYTATKHGVVSFVKSTGDAEYYDKDHIRINCVCPSTVDTELLKEIKSFARELLQTMEKKTPLLTAERAAEAVRVLVEDDSLNGASMIFTCEEDIVPFKVDTSILN